MSATQIPRLDFAAFSDDLQGQWVVVRVGDEQKVIGHGQTAAEALSASGVQADDETAVLTQVPADVPVAYMGQASTD